MHIKRDNLHWSPCRVDSYDKPFNFIIGARESGKTTGLLLKIYKKWKHTQRPSIVLRRQSVDITAAYIDSIGETINDFVREPIKLSYKKGSIKDGVVDVFVDDVLFLRIMSLSVPKARFKSLHIDDPYCILYDEFLVDMANGEKYATDEAGKFREIYETFNRFAMQHEHSLKLYCAGNPYSAYSPLLVWLDVPLDQLHPGAFLIGPNYIVDCYQLKPELIAHIKKLNPLANIEDEYARYAFSGIAINDRNIETVPKQPTGYQLRYIIRLQQKVLKVYHRAMQRHQGTDFGKYWIEEDDDYIGSKTTFAVDFNNLSKGSVLLTSQQRLLLIRLKQAIGNRDVTYSSISAFYLLTGCYNQL